MRTTYGKLKVGDRFSFHGGTAVFEKVSDSDIVRIRDDRMFTYDQGRFSFDDKTEVFKQEKIKK